MRKVLNAKHGVITEERFRKMTFAQWLFHYIEVLRAEKEENDKFEILISYMELVGSMANPEAGKKLQEMKEQRKYEKELSAETFAQSYEQFKSLIPQKIEVKSTETSKKFLLPKFDKEEYKKTRKLGISKGGEVNGNE